MYFTIVYNKKISNIIRIYSIHNDIRICILNKIKFKICNKNKL